MDSQVCLKRAHVRHFSNTVNAVPPLEASPDAVVPCQEKPFAASLTAPQYVAAEFLLTHQTSSGIRSDSKSEFYCHYLNVGKDEYIIRREPEVRTNHSCDPTPGLRTMSFSRPFGISKRTRKSPSITPPSVPMTGKWGAVAARRAAGEWSAITAICRRA
jgi:hypothetical protein